MGLAGGGGLLRGLRHKLAAVRPPLHCWHCAAAAATQPTFLRALSQALGHPASHRCSRNYPATSNQFLTSNTTDRQRNRPTTKNRPHEWRPRATTASSQIMWLLILSSQLNGFPRIARAKLCRTASSGRHTQRHAVPLLTSRKK